MDTLRQKKQDKKNKKLCLDMYYVGAGILPYTTTGGSISHHTFRHSPLWGNDEQDDVIVVDDNSPRGYSTKTKSIKYATKKELSLF